MAAMAKAKATAVAAQESDSNPIVTEADLRDEMAAEDKVIDGASPKAEEATLPATILEENPAIREDKMTRVTAGDNSGYLHNKKPRPIAWPGLFVCCL